MGYDDKGGDFSGQLDRYHMNPMNDVLFKYTFGKEEHKDITIDLISSIFMDSGGNGINDLTFTSTEMIPQNADDKLSRLDVACELSDKKFVDVEVQVINYHNMARRTLYYWTQMYLMSLATGDNYKMLRPVITINILAFKLLPGDEPHSMYGLYNMKTGHRLTNDMEIHFLEVPKFKKKPVSEMTKLERWLAYFKNKMTKNEKEELSMSDAAIKSAYNAADTFFMTPAERINYVNRQMAIMDYNSSIEHARDEGMTKGRAKGRAEGRAEGETYLGKLIKALSMKKRYSDIERAATDADFRQKLYKEYGINDTR